MHHVGVEPISVDNQLSSAQAQKPFRQVVMIELNCQPGCNEIEPIQSFCSEKIINHRRPKRKIRALVYQRKTIGEKTVLFTGE